MAAEFIYPTRGNFSDENNNQMINMFDTLYVKYNSSWSSLNLTLFCLDSTTSTQWQYLDVQGNPILASGTYNFGTIQAVNFDINQYPTNCHFKLTEYGNNDDALNGESFWVTSDAALSTTFQPTSTAITSGSGAATTQSAKSTGLASVAASTSSSRTSTSSLTTNPTTSPAPASSGLSTGAKAGIGVGVAAAVLIISALLFIIWHMQRKAQTNEQNNAHEKPELPGSTLGVADAEMHTPNNFQPYKHEMEGSRWAELEGAQHGPSYRHELSS